jgi:hypothetical protein
LKRVSLYAPFTGGMVTDAPAYQLGPQNSVFAQDGFSPTGFFKQRAGWAYDGTTADAADILRGVYRAQFALADVTRTITTSYLAYIHNASSAGTAIEQNDVSQPVLPRCMYRDQLVLCYQDGVTPLKLYSGAPTKTITSTGSWTTNANAATLTGGTFGSTPSPGYYLDAVWDTGGDIRIVEGNSTSSITLEDVYSASTTSAGSGMHADATGTTTRCVSIYNAGTITIAATVGTGVGTKWQTLGVGNDDGLLVIPTSGDASLNHINAVSAETTMEVIASDVATGTSYHILKACPFKDAAAHKNSFWGTGVVQYPNRVYISPPNWNPSVPPGFELPWDPNDNTSANANDFLLDFIDVPAPYDGDHNVAILQSPNPLLVLKRHAVYGIYGSYGSVTVDMIADGIGCIDIRSAQSFDEGQFWAGEGGIYWYVNQTVVDLTAGKINREWRALTRDFDYGTSDYCSIGLASGHLVVHITTAGGTTQRTYLCDLRDQSWQSRLSNVTPRYMFSSRINGEAEKLLATPSDLQGRVVDLAPMLNGAGTAKDDAGSAPRLQAYTSSAIAQANGIDGWTRMVDLDVHANVYDAGAAGSTQLDVSVVSGGGIGNEADSTKTLTSIDSDTVDRIDRHPFRVARPGRFHQVRFAVDPLGTDTAATKVEIHQLSARFRNGREGA